VSVSVCVGQCRAPALSRRDAGAGMQGLERGGGAPGDAGALAHDLQGFHPLNAGIAFRGAFRWGLRGDFLRFTAVRPRPGLAPAWGAPAPARAGASRAAAWEPWRPLGARPC
jgi:hypothetical protein